MSEISYCKQCGVFGEAEIAPVNSAGIPYCWNCGISKDGKNVSADCINCAFLFCSNSGFLEPSEETVYEIESECSQCGGDMDIDCWVQSCELAKFQRLLHACESAKLQRLLHDPETIKEEPTSKFFT
jgi:hypothetical protein